MKFLATIILACALVGCKAKPYTATPGADALAGAGNSIAAAQANVDALKPHIDSEGGLLLGAIQRQLQTANDLIKQGQKSYHGLADANVKLTEQNNRFWSRRQREWFWFFVIGWAGIGIFGAVCSLWGWTGASVFIMRFLPFSNVFALLRNRITPNVVTVNVNTPRAAG